MSRRMPHSSGPVTAANKQDGVQEKQNILLASESGHFSVIRALHLADFITELNGFCGFMSILSSMQYCVGRPFDTGALWIALSFMPFSLFFDFMDGRVARWQKKSSLMGQELDSLADLISFGVAPATIAFAIGLRTPVDHLFLAMFVLCGLTRIARFNITVAVLPKDKSGKLQYFEGIPMPMTLALAGLMAFWIYHGRIHENIPLGLLAEGTPFEFHVISLLFITQGCLLVSKTLHIPKP